MICVYKYITYYLFDNTKQCKNQLLSFTDISYLLIVIICQEDIMISLNK